MTLWYEDPVKLIADWLFGLLTGWGLSVELTQFILTVIGAAVIGIGALLFCIFLIWYERKILGRIQDRFGPNRVGPWGIFQPFADMLKIFIKEFITPQGADIVPYNLAPILSVAAVLLIWTVIPFTMTIMGVNLNVGLILIIGSGGLGLLAIIMAGYGSNNKYALLGGSRAVAQLISYEVPMVMALLVPTMLAGSLGVNDIVQKQSVPFLFMAPIAAVVFFLTSVAESGRSPFDLLEAESEIVAGFMTEYSGLKFGFFYVAEFLHAFTISMLFSTLFLGGWRGPFSEQIPLLGFGYLVVKTFIVYFLVILFRGSLPRFRIDQMMDLNWKLLTPLSLIGLLITALVANPLAGMPVVQVIVLFVVNLVAMVVVMNWAERKMTRRRKIIGKPRPLATPNQREDHLSA
jgi:NADH-quinone oxidoreductase subunit H